MKTSIICFASNETGCDTRNISAHLAAINGGYSPNVVYSANTPSLASALDGFTVQNGGP